MAGGDDRFQEKLRVVSEYLSFRQIPQAVCRGGGVKRGKAEKGAGLERLTGVVSGTRSKRNGRVETTGR